MNLTNGKKRIFKVAHKTETKPIVVHFKPEERERNIEAIAGKKVSETKLIRASVQLIFKNPRLFEMALREARNI